MNICSGGRDKKHPCIAFEGNDCPMCEWMDGEENAGKALKVAQDRIEELEDENKTLSGRQAY